MREKPKTKIKWFSRFSRFVLKIMRYLIFFLFKFNYFTFFLHFCVYQVSVHVPADGRRKLHFCRWDSFVQLVAMKINFRVRAFRWKLSIEKLQSFWQVRKFWVLRRKISTQTNPRRLFSKGAWKDFSSMTKTKSNWLWIQMRRSWFKRLLSLVFTAKIFSEIFIYALPVSFRISFCQSDRKGIWSVLGEI